MSIPEDRGRSRAWSTSALVGLWVAAAAVAVTVGILAVTTVGATLRDRGPIGNEVVREDLQEQSVEVDPEQPRVERTITDEFGEMVVACQGFYAIGVDARPDEAAGWRTVSYEVGPDDDIDAVFANRGRSIEVEVYCNRGQPTVSDLERNTLPDDS